MIPRDDPFRPTQRRRVGQRTIVPEKLVPGSTDADLIRSVEVDTAPLEDGQGYFYDATQAKLVPRTVSPGTSGSTLTVREEDGAPSDSAVTLLRFPNGTLVDNGVGDVSYIPAGGGGGSITIREEDGTPSDTAVTLFKVPNGWLVDNGVGDVSLVPSAAVMGPTIFVAASDAHADVIASTPATYRCDGTDDHVQIQAAISALPAAGGTVVLSEGAFFVGAEQITLRSGLHLKGQGMGITTLFLQNGANGRMIRNTTGRTDIMFEGITFDGNGSNQTDGAARDDRSLLMLDLITGFTVIYCEIKNGRHGAALRLDQCDRTLYLGNRFLNNGTAGAAFIGDHSFISNSEYYRVVGNHYDSATDTGTAQDGVQHSTVVGNTYTNCELGISVSNSSTEASRFNTVANNVIKGRGGVGTGTSVGIKVSTFANPGPGNMKDVVIDGNVIENCDRAMWVEEVDRCRIANNSFSDAVGANGQLMLLNTTGTLNYLWIESNLFFNTTNRGISFDTGGTAANFVRIKDNEFQTVTTPIGGTIPADCRIRGVTGQGYDESDGHRFNGNIGIRSAPPTQEYFIGFPTTYTATTADVRLITAEPTIIFPSGSASFSGLYGSPRARFPGGSAGNSVIGLNFEAFGVNATASSSLDVVSVKGLAVKAGAFAAGASITINVTDLIGVESNLTVQSSTGTENVTNGIVVNCRDWQGGSIPNSLTNYYGVKVDQITTGSNRYPLFDGTTPVASEDSGAANASTTATATVLTPASGTAIGWVTNSWRHATFNYVPPSAGQPTPLTLFVTSNTVNAATGSAGFSVSVGGNAAITYTGTTLKDTRLNFGLSNYVGAIVTSGASTMTVTSVTTGTNPNDTLNGTWSGGTPSAGAAYSIRNIDPENGGSWSVNRRVANNFGQNVQMFSPGATAFGGGVGVLSLANCVKAPPTPPVNSSLFYSEGNRMKALGGNGVLTVIT